MATNNENYQSLDNAQIDEIEKWLINNGYSNDNSGYIIGKARSYGNFFEGLKNEIGQTNYEKLSQDVDIVRINELNELKDKYEDVVYDPTIGGEFRSKISASKSNGIDNSNILSYEEWSKLQDLHRGTTEEYADYLRINGVEGSYTASDNLISDLGSLDGYNKNNPYDTDDIENLMNLLKGLPELPYTSAMTISEKYMEISEDTRAKLSSEITSGEDLEGEVLAYFRKWDSFVQDIYDNLNKVLNQINEINARTPTTTDPTPPGLPGGGASSGYGGSSSSDSGPAPTIPEVDANTESPDVYIQSAVVGTLLFTNIVSLYDELGKPSTIQSSLTQEYEVVGIFLYEDKYYYRIYDKNLGKYYYAEIDGNSIFTTEYEEILKMNEDAMMLSSPDIGENVLSKMSDINEVYFVNGSLPGEGELEGITFVNVLDGMDGQNYYIPLSDSVELVNLDVFTAGILGTDVVEPDISVDVTGNVG